MVVGDAGLKNRHKVRLVKGERQRGSRALADVAAREVWTRERGGGGEDWVFLFKLDSGDWATTLGVMRWGHPMDARIIAVRHLVATEGRKGGGYCNRGGL